MARTHFNGLTPSTADFGVRDPIVMGVGVYGIDPMQGAYGGGAITLDWTLSHFFTIQLSENATITLPAPKGSYIATLYVYQDNGGNWTLSWPMATKFPGGVPPVISTGEYDITLLELSTDGTTWYVRSLGDIPIVPPELLSITLGPVGDGGQVEMPVEAPWTQQLVATGHYSDGSTADITASIDNWDSSDETHDTVSAGGLVTSIEHGNGSTSTITASLGDVDGTVVVNNGTF